MTSEEIKQSISMREIVGRYGIRIDRKGFCCCPFHHEKTASMKVYKDSYYCYGCGANGDIFRFVQDMDNTSFKEAFLSLGGKYEHDNNEHKRAMLKYAQQKKKETIEAQKKNRQAQLLAIDQEINILRIIKRVVKPFDPMWCEAVNRFEYLLYVSEELRKEG